MRLRYRWKRLAARRRAPGPACRHWDCPETAIGAARPSSVWCTRHTKAIMELEYEVDIDATLNRWTLHPGRYTP